MMAPIRSSTAYGIQTVLGLLALLGAQGIALAQTAPIEPIEPILRSELTARKDPDFSPLLNKWAAVYGATAVLPLLHLAADERLAEPERTIALVSAARIGGRTIVPSVLPFL